MAGRQTLLQAFDRHWNGWRRGLAACRDDPTRPAVHALRVQSRRLLALLEIVGHVARRAPAARRRLARGVEGTLDQLSRLRDAQVQRRAVARAQTDDELDALVRHLQRRVTRHRRRAVRALATADRRGVRSAAAEIRRAIARVGPPGPSRQSQHAIAAAVDAAAANVRDGLLRLDPTRPRTVHRFRVALKRLRYTTEIAERLTPRVHGVSGATLKALQGRLGDMHDAEILVERLARFARRHPADAGPALDRLRDVLHRTRDRRLAGLDRALVPLRRALAGQVAPPREAVGQAERREVEG